MIVYFGQVERGIIKLFNGCSTGQSVKWEYGMNYEFPLNEA